MTLNSNGASQNGSVLRLITNGMTVYDVQGERIGKVEDLYFGANADDSQPLGAGAATTGTPRATETSGVVGDIVEGLFGNDALPETLRNRLLNEGFIQIEPGTLFGGDLFATPDQISSASGDGVRLNVAVESLIRR